MGGSPNGLATSSASTLAAEKGRDNLGRGAGKVRSRARTSCQAPSWTQGADRLIPDWKNAAHRCNQPVTDDAYVFLSERSAARPNVVLPPFAHNHGNYIVSLGNVTSWMGEQAEALGVEIFPALPPPRCCTATTAAVEGVATGNLGIGRKVNRRATSSSAWNCTPEYRVCRRRARPPGQTALIARLSTKPRSAELWHRHQGTVEIDPSATSPAL